MNINTRKRFALLLIISLMISFQPNLIAEEDLVTRINQLMKEKKETTSEIDNADELNSESFVKNSLALSEDEVNRISSENEVDNEMDLSGEIVTRRSSFNPELMMIDAQTKVYTDSNLTSLLGEVDLLSVVYALSPSGNAMRIAFVTGSEVLEGYVSSNSLTKMSDRSKANYAKAAQNGKIVYSERLLGISFIKASATSRISPTIKPTTVTPTPKITVTPSPTTTPVSTSTAKVTATPTAKTTNTPTANVTASPTAKVTSIPSSATTVPTGYPEIVGQPRSISAMDGKYTVLYLKADNVIDYQWQYSTDHGTVWRNLTDSSVWRGINKSTLYFIPLPQYDGYLFRCTLTNRMGTVYSDYIELNANDNSGSRPIISVHPQDFSAIEGTMATFSVDALNVDYYQWQYSINGKTWTNVSGSDLSGGTSATLSIYAIKSLSNYMFRCVVSNGVGTEYSNAATLSVVSATATPNVMPTVKPTAVPSLSITVQPQNVSARAETEIRLSIKAENASAYQWYYRKNASDSWKQLFDDAIWSGVNTNVLSFMSKATFNSYQFYCEVYGLNTSLASNSVVFNYISEDPVFDSSIDTIVTGVIGSYVTLKAKVSNAISYQWEVNPKGNGTWTAIIDNSVYQNTKGPELKIKLISGGMSHTYRLKVVSVSGTAYSPVYSLREEVSTPSNVSETPVSTANKINAVTFSQMGDKYIGTSYYKYDCQAFVERMLEDAGLYGWNLAGSNAWYRQMSWRGTPEQCISTFGCIPTGAFLFILKHDGGEPAHYRDNLGNASHIGVVTHRNGGAIHSSYSRGGVYTSVFNDATIPNGGWNMVGLWTRMDYGDAVNSILESLTGR